MGVTGLWRLVEPAGKPVPVETLENKVLAVDISIWLHQVVKGYQDTKGAPLPNAHLMGLFQRLCKLLYFRIKPVFVFDGGFPDLKRETIAKRQDHKSKYNSESERIKRELALLLSKKTAISSLLGKNISPKKASSSGAANDDDLFKLPALPASNNETESESEDESESSSSSLIDLHTVDLESAKFKGMPVKEKYDLLLELKETRKMNSWGKIHELPKKSDNFSDFQMQRLLKRRKIQECLEETEKEIGDGGMSLNDLESLLNEEGIDTKIESIPTRRIASNNSTRYLLINNVKQALLEAKKKEQDLNTPGTSTEEEKTVKTKVESPKKDELEEDLEKAIKMSLECINEQDISNCTSKTDDSWTSIITDSDYTEDTDSEEGDGFEQPDMSSAKAYIMQYSDFTNKAIEKIIANKTTVTNKPKNSKLDEILEEINREKSILIAKIELSSDEESKENLHDSQEIKDRESAAHNNGEIDATQSSVVYIENPGDNIILLDSSLDEMVNNDLNSDIKFKKSQEVISKTRESEEESCVQDEIETQEIIKQKSIILSSNEGLFNSDKADSSSPIKENIDSTDDNFEHVPENDNEIKQPTNKVIKEESSSSDDEFEDVSELENENKKTVVQLTLEMGQECDEDDIFADIFSNKQSNVEDTEQTPNKANESQVKVFAAENKEIGLLYKNAPTLETVTNDCTTHHEGSPKKILSTKVEKEKQRNIHVDTVTTYEQDKLTEINNDEASCSNETINVNSSALISTSENNYKIENSTNKNNRLVKKLLSIEKLNEMVQEVETEEQDLIQEKGRLDRVGRNITEQMTKDAQELLQLFGIPYVVAPMEAEAQCAFLENVKLTDGTITDDSDIWLFGGKTVYKNFFNQKKHVLQFQSERIEKSFNLTREQLVLLALLVGSDYTTGVTGVGPVTALEILASFPYNKKLLLDETSQGRYHQIVTGLQEFKKWVRTGKRTDNTTLKKKLKNVNLSDDFPSVRVVQAYLDPNVEKSEEKFTWGELDITVLRDYTKKKFGWSQSKLDELIKPVLKRMLERKSQKTVHDYFKRKVEFQSLEEQMSKRVKAAVQRMGPEDLLETELASDNPVKTQTITKRKLATDKSNKPQSKVKRSRTKVAGSTVREINTGVDNSDVAASVVSQITDCKAGAEIKIPKTGRFQEIIPQREKDKQSLLENKMKAIEVFRKTTIDRKKKLVKRKAIVPKDKADLSESSDED